MIAASKRTKLTPPELAKQWGIDVAKVLHWIKIGELRAINAATDRNGRSRYLIDLADLSAFEAARTVQPPMPRLRKRRSDSSIIEFF
jgi:hypothetical protein